VREGESLRFEPKKLLLPPVLHLAIIKGGGEVGRREVRLPGGSDSEEGLHEGALAS